MDNWIVRPNISGTIQTNEIAKLSIVLIMGNLVAAKINRFTAIYSEIVCEIFV